MSLRRIAVIPGDGIGPEIMDATLSIIESTGFDADWIYLDAGLGAIGRCGQAVPPETVEAIREIGLAIKGPTTTPSGGGPSSAHRPLREKGGLCSKHPPAHPPPRHRAPLAEQ